MKQTLILKPEERLIVAADYSPLENGGIKGVKAKVLALAQELEGLGVYIKVNSILRACGYDLVTNLHDLGLKVFADLKLVDIPNTMKTDGEMLLEVKPDILTVMCCAGINGMSSVEKVLGSTTEVLGVTILTTFTDEECQAIFTCSAKEGVIKFSRMADASKLGGLILSPQELNLIDTNELVLSLNTPGIRPVWSLIEGDDQVRIMTPEKAFENGADRAVIGRPILQARPNNQGFPQSPREAVLRTIDEIKNGLKMRGN